MTNFYNKIGGKLAEDLPKPPSNVEVSVEGEVATVTWTNNEASPWQFQLYVQVFDNGIWNDIVVPQHTGYETSHQVTGFTEYKPYSVRVAIKHNGTGRYYPSPLISTFLIDEPCLSEITAVEFSTMYMTELMFDVTNTYTGTATEMPSDTERWRIYVNDTLVWEHPVYPGQWWMVEESEFVADGVTTHDVKFAYFNGETECASYTIEGFVVGEAEETDVPKLEYHDGESQQLSCSNAQGMSLIESGEDEGSYYTNLMLYEAGPYFRPIMCPSGDPVNLNEFSEGLTNCTIWEEYEEGPLWFRYNLGGSSDYVSIYINFENKTVKCYGE